MNKKRIIFVLILILILSFFVYKVFLNKEIIEKRIDKIEVGESIKTISLVEVKDEYYDKYYILPIEENIKITSLGKKEIYYYLVNKETKEKKKVKVDFKVVDTTSPIIKDDEIYVNINDDKDIRSYLNITDNLDENIEDIEITGQVDLKRRGTYSIFVKATDKSGNSVNKEVKVNVITPYIPMEKIDILKGKWVNKEKGLVLSFYNSYSRASYSFGKIGEKLNYNGYVSNIDIKDKYITLIVSYNESDWQKGESPKYKFAKMIIEREDTELKLELFMEYENIYMKYAGESWSDVEKVI